MHEALGSILLRSPCEARLDKNLVDPDSQVNILEMRGVIG